MLRGVRHWTRTRAAIAARKWQKRRPKGSLLWDYDFGPIIGANIGIRSSDSTMHRFKVLERTLHVQLERTSLYGKAKRMRAAIAVSP